MIAAVKNVPPSMMMKMRFGCAGMQQQPDYWAVVPFAVLFARTGDPILRPRARRDDSYYAAFILKWLTPHSVPSA